MWEFVSPFVVPSLFGLANSAFRAHRYGPEHLSLNGRTLDAGLHANLNRLYRPK